MRPHFVEAKSERKDGRVTTVNNHYKGVAIVDGAFHISKDPLTKTLAYHFNPREASFGGLAELIELDQPETVDPVEQSDQTETETDTSATLKTQKLTDKQLALLSKLRERNPKTTWEVLRDAQTQRQIINHPENFDLSDFT